VEAGTTSAVIYGLTLGQKHNIWMKAFDANGNRSEQNAVVLATPSGESGKDNPGSRNLVSVNGEDDDESGSGEGDDADGKTFGCGGW